MNKATDEAVQRSIKLLGKPYPGRGIFIGRSARAYNIVLGTWTMGHSTGSRNRVYVRDDHHGPSDYRTVRTESINDPGGENTDLTLYNAMRSREGLHVASNGHQTDDLIARVYKRLDFGRVLQSWNYEPNDPIYTPRISAACSVGHGDAHCLVHFANMSTIYCDEITGKSVHRTWDVKGDIDAHPGTGWCLVTYDPEADEPRSFTKAPLPIPLALNPSDMLCWMYEHLNYEHLVSLAVKWVDLRNPGHFAGTWVWNKYNVPPQ